MKNDKKLCPPDPHFTTTFSSPRPVGQSRALGTIISVVLQCVCFCVSCKGPLPHPLAPTDRPCEVLRTSSWSLSGGSKFGAKLFFVRSTTAQVCSTKVCQDDFLFEIALNSFVHWILRCFALILGRNVHRTARGRTTPAHCAQILEQLNNFNGQKMTQTKSGLWSKSYSLLSAVHQVLLDGS